MSRKIITVLLACLALFGLFAAPAGAEMQPGESHWRKGNQTGTNRQYLIYVHYDTDVGYGSSLDPSIRDNYTAQYSAELNQAIAKLDAHPDLRVVRETSSSIPCHDNFPVPVSEGDNRNCVEFYRTGTDWMEQRSGAVGAIGLASWWQAGFHVWNDGGGANDENTWFSVAWELYNLNPELLDNVFCHELLHTMDLDHPVDGTEGPCGGGVVRATDNNALDKTYCTTHSDVQPAPRGSTLAGSDTSAHVECVNQPTPEGFGATPSQVLVSDTLAEAT